MKHTIRILTLLAAMILTAGHVWGTPAIKVKVTGGSIKLYSTYSNGALSNQISTAAAGATVYIKATPDALFTPVGMTFNAYASTGSGVAQARTRNGSNTDPGIGQTIEVSPVAGQPGIFTFTMPANGTNVNIDATFAAKAKETVSYIDTDGKTKEKEAYVLDGTEVTLGEIGTTESYTEFWYVCKTDLSYTNLNFSSSCNVNIILADNVEMKVENSTAINCHGSLGLYGQSTGDNKGALIAKSTGGSNAIQSEGNITISGAKVTATGDKAIYIFDGGVSITGGTVTANGTSYGIYVNKGVTISGSEVKATGDKAIYIFDGGVSITGGTVTANGTSYGIYVNKGVTISGSEVKATGDQAIYSVGGSVSITGGTVTANGTSYGINTKGVTISGSEVTATGNQAINSVNGVVSIADVSKVTANGTSYGINAVNGVTISGSEVTATGDWAIYSVGGSVSITDASTITAEGTSNGIKAYGVTISGSKVKAITGGTVTANGTSYGINANNGVTISGSEVTATGNRAFYSLGGSVSITDASTITANGTSFGIKAYNDVTISGSEVTATGDNAIWSEEGDVDITGGTVIANGTSYGIRATGSDKDITISGANVTAKATGTYGEAIFSLNCGVSITDASTVTANGTSYGINANNGVTISGSEVTATGDQAIFSVSGGVSIADVSKVTANGTSYGINANNGVTITGGTVIATGSSYGILAFGGVTISGSQVIATSGEKGFGIQGDGDIVLGWTNTTDFIMASSYKAGYGKAVTTADGKRFMAYTVDNTNPQSPVETPAAVISGTVSDLTTIAGKMLRPLEDYYVSIPSGLSIVDKTPTFTSGSTSYYKTAENDKVTIKVDNYDQKGFELIGTNLPANITFNNDFTQATFTITAAYVAITDIRYYTTEVAYVDADGHQATTPAADGETPATKVYILTGTETTIGEKGKETWYISNTIGDGLEYNGMITFMGNVHLILADNSKMTVKGAIYQRGSNDNHDELHIYGQGGTTEGKLTAELESDGAIQCYYTDIIINGGTIIATGESGIFANSITINGGQLTAMSSSTDDADYGIFASSITLNLSKTTDFVCASSYGYYEDNPISWQVVDGKVLKYTDDSGQLQLIHSGTLGSEEVAALAGKKITFFGCYGGYCGQDKKETTDVDESKNVMWCIAPDDPATEDIDESKTITISGTGYMMYYDSIENTDDKSWSNGAPWKAFADKIEAVVIEDGITYVGSNTFAHCPNIKSVTLPAEGIYEIGPGAFADCTSLTSIDIPMSVNNIGDGAFAGCSNLATVSIGYGKATSFTIGTDVFPATTTILVPEAALSGYQTAEGWSTYQIAPATRTLFAADATNKWMTWCDKYAYVKPDGVMVYTVSSVATDKVTLAEVSGGVIPAYTPVLLYREAAGEAAVTATFSAVGTAPASDYDISSGIVEANISNNVTLYGNSGDGAYASGNSNNIYAISDLSDTQSYVLRNGHFVAVDKDGGIGAHRCWLNVTKSTTNGARLLSINTGGESTEIETTYFTNPANSSGAWYGLDGRKLDKQPTKKGLYIYNGKKHVIK